MSTGGQTLKRTHLFDCRILVGLVSLVADVAHAAGRMLRT
jgi:hypothetical protein